MLSFKEEKGAEELIKDFNKNATIYQVTDQVTPGILSTDPMSLLSKTKLYGLKKKYGLTKTFLGALDRAYSRKEEFFSPPTKYLNEQLAVSEIESEILSKMKYEFIDHKYKFLPVFDFTQSDKYALHTTFISSSSAGKSYLASQILLKNIKFPRKRKVYIICANPNNDVPWINFRSDFKKMGGTAVLLDANEICLAGNIELSSLSRSSIVVIDDEEILDNSSVLTNLSRKILIEGRKWSTPGMGGLVLFSIKHSLHNGISSKWHSTESAGFIVFPRNQQLARKILRTKLHFSAKLVQKCIELGGKGRYAYVYIRNSPSPSFVSSNQGIFLL